MDRCAGHVRIAHRLIQGKAASVDQYTQTRTDAPGLAVLLGNHTDDPPVFDNQFADRRVYAQIDPGLECGLHHPALQGRACRHIGFSGQPRHQRAQTHAQQRFFGRPRFLDMGQFQRVFQRHRQCQEIRTQQRLVLAQFIGIEQVSHNCATRHGTTGRFVIIVRPMRDARKFQPLADKEVQHPRSFDYVGQPSRARCTGGIIAVTHDMIEIRRRLLGAVRNAGLGHERIVRNPHHATRTGGSPADETCLFKHKRRLAGRTRNQCSNH